MRVRASRHDRLLLEREESAWRDVARTAIRPGVAWALTLFFLATLLAQPVTQHVIELSSAARSPSVRRIPQAYDIFATLGRVPDHWAQERGGLWTRLMGVNGRLQRDIADYETALEENSAAGKLLLPRTQWILTKYLGHGNEQVYPGRNGWLFYRPDIDYVTSPGFLTARSIRPGKSPGTSSRHADPRTAILDFHRQLERRGIHLVVVPIPVKSVVHAEHFGPAQLADEPVQNSSYKQFITELQKTGVKVFNADSVLRQIRRPGGPDLYLASDTHWRPEAMQAVAVSLAQFIQNQCAVNTTKTARLRAESGQVANLGDIAQMLRLPETQSVFKPETVTIRQILTETGEFWRPHRSAEILLLGDSFANIFSLPGLNWGESAGLAEQLSFELGRPIDTILRNDNGAWATRQMLADQLARGHDRLNGKRVVVWQFAMRELSEGNWKPVSLDVARASQSSLLTLESDETLLARGTIQDISAIPKPGRVPYRDHIATIHLIDLEGEQNRPAMHREAVVYVWSMRDNHWTDAAAWRPGQRVALRLRPWRDMEARLDGVNRSELDDDELLLAEPLWGEMP